MLLGLIKGVVLDKAGASLLDWQPEAGGRSYCKKPIWIITERVRWSEGKIKFPSKHRARGSASCWRAQALPPWEVRQHCPQMYGMAQHRLAGHPRFCLIPDSLVIHGSGEGGRVWDLRPDPLVPNPKPTKSLGTSPLAFPVFQSDSCILNEYVDTSGKNK